MDIECATHPQAEVRYLRLRHIRSVRDWRASVIFACQECHEALLREKALKPLPYPGQMVIGKFARAA